MAGPPVEKVKARGPPSARPESAWSPARRVNVQRSPAGRSRGKSYTQMPVSTQRPAPDSAQTTSKGSVSRGSPRGTMGTEKWAWACRTCFTVPWGEKALT